VAQTKYIWLKSNAWLKATDKLNTIANTHTCTVYTTQIHRHSHLHTLILTQILTLLIVGTNSVLIPLIALVAIIVNAFY